VHHQRVRVVPRVVDLWRAFGDLDFFIWLRIFGEYLLLIFFDI
jgi:hypothetical protein